MDPTRPSQPNSEQATSEQVLHLRDARLAALEHVALDLTSTLQLGDVLQRVAQMAQSLTDSVHAHIYLYDSQLDEIQYGASHWGKEYTPTPLKPRRAGITHTVIQSGTPMFIEAARDHAAYAQVPSDQSPGALACLPLVKGERILGTLNIGYWQTHPFDDETRRFLTLMARYAAIAIDNAQLYASATRSAAELRRLYDTSLDISSQLDPNKLLDLIIHRAAELLHCTMGNFYIYDKQRNELVPRAPFGDQGEGPGVLKMGEGATSRVFQSGEPLVIQDYDVWQDRVDRIPLGRYARSLHVPVRQGEHIIGVMSVHRPKSDPAFTEEEERLLMLFANHAAIALENARLYQVAVDKARMDHELEMAHQLQASLLPHEIPQVKGWEFQARWYPAREVSGDFIDFVSMRLPGPVRVSPLQLFLIADVSDKGMPAALYMALTRSTLRASITYDRSPAECLTHANQLMSGDSANGMFVTLCYAQLDPATGELIYVNAGHNPPLWFHSRDKRLVELTRTGPALGVYDDRTYAQETIALDPGDFVLFYTDGITDALNAAEEEFGEARLHEAILDHCGGSAGEIILAVEQSLWTFVGERTPEDDITLVLIKRL